MVVLELLQDTTILLKTIFKATPTIKVFLLFNYHQIFLDVHIQYVKDNIY